MTTTTAQSIHTHARAAANAPWPLCPKCGDSLLSVLAGRWMRERKAAMVLGLAMPDAPMMEELLKGKWICDVCGWSAERLKMEDAA